MKDTSNVGNALSERQVRSIAGMSEFKLFIIFILVAFVYALVAMIVAREIVIPRLLPSVNGNIEGDPQVYLSLAIQMTERIKELGFSAWELRPSGQGPAGIGSLIYLIEADVYSFVVLNAILFIVSITFMIGILRFWFSLTQAMLASVPLVLSPYMIIWFSQLNKDIYILAGSLIYIYALLYFNSRRLNFDWRSVGKTVILASIGIFLCSLMRPYLNQVILPATILIFIGFAFTQVKMSSIFEQIKALGVATIICVLLVQSGHGAASDETLRGFEEYRFLHSQVNGVPTVDSLVSNCLSNVSVQNWKMEKWLPDSIEQKLKSMMGQRCLIFTLLESQTNATTLQSLVDKDHLPSGSLEALNYLPRAAMQGILAPLPDKWFTSYDGKISSFYYLVGLESMFLYVCFVGLFLWIVKNRNWSVFIPLSMSLSIMWAYGATTPFIGALYRYRYPWWMLILCLGFAAWIDLVRKSRFRHAMLINNESK